MTKCPNGTTLLKVAVHCPSCNRKLMTVRRTRDNMPCAVIIDVAKPGLYSAETRCPGCHCYVGITV